MSKKKNSKPGQQDAKDAADGVERLPNFVADRFRAWRATRFVEDRHWFAQLVMVISCCDSRVDISTMLGVQPGEIFQVRNVANLCPPYEPDHSHHGTSAAIEFAVTGLRIPHIVVIGHAHCGGVAAYLERRDTGREASEGVSFIDTWTDILAPSYERLPAPGPRGGPEDGPEAARARGRALEKEGVLGSLRNLMSFPFVSEAIEAGRLSLHGAWFDIAEGALHAYDPETRAFHPL